MRRRGFVLIVVIFFVALLMIGVAALLRRSTLDAAIVRNRDYAARAEALARGGVRLALVLLQQDLLEEQRAGVEVDARTDLWARVSDAPPFETADGGSLKLRIRDAGSLLDVNVFRVEAGKRDEAYAYLVDFFGKVIEEMPGRPEEKPWDPEELARHLLDYLDADEVGMRGESELEWYQKQGPDERPANRPLLSFDELALVRGFERPLIEALRPYLTVYPLEGGGVNPNTADPWVLASLHVGDALDKRLGGVDVVRDVERQRSDRPICEQAEHCTVWPPPGQTTFPPANQYRSDVFLVQAEARYGDVGRTLDVVIDREKPAEPVFYDWRVR